MKNEYIETIKQEITKCIIQKKQNEFKQNQN